MKILHWLTTFALIVATHGHLRIESDQVYTEEKKERSERHPATFFPHPSDHTDSFDKVALSVTDKRQIVMGKTTHVGHGRSLLQSPARFRAVYVYVGDGFEGLLPHHAGESHSQAGQDNLVATLLNCKTHGFFLDVAANDAVSLSNTFKLERDYKWDGVCVEPNPDYWPKLALRNCRTIGAVLGSETGAVVKFDERGVGSGIVAKGMDNEESAGGTNRTTVRIDDVLEFVHAPERLDYFSFDVEGAESLIASAFPWQKYKISVMTVERPNDDVRAIFEQHGLEYLRKNSGWNDQTWIDSGITNRSEIVARFNDGSASDVVNTRLKKCNVESNEMKRRQPDFVEALPQGWKALHIFARDETNDVASNAMSVSMSDLLCMSSGYFIDLAGDHHHVASSTRVLESRGWKGLCIGSNPHFWKASASGHCKIVGTLKDPSIHQSLGDTLKAMQVPASIEFVVGGAAQLQEFPWDLFSVAVVSLVDGGPRGRAATLLKQFNYTQVEGSDLWIARDRKECKPDAQIQINDG